MRPLAVSEASAGWTALLNPTSSSAGSTSVTRRGVRDVERFGGRDA